MLRRRYRGGRGGRGVRALLAKFRRRALGTRKTGPWDQYILTGDSGAHDCTPDRSTTIGYKIWGWGAEVATMLTNIRSEAISTLLGGAVLYQPTLLVWGFTTFDILSAANSAIKCEIVLGTCRNNNADTISDLGTNFINAWAQSYDNRPTDFEDFPSTSVLQNLKFWGGNNSRGYRPTRRIVTSVGVGRPKRFTFRFKTRRFTYEDYSQAGFLTEGMARGRTVFAVVKYHAERQQVCGILDMEAAPLMTEGGGQFITKLRQFYFYRWIPGNNRPTVYGGYTGAEEVIEDTAKSWIGVPALRAQRFSGPGTFNNPASFGGLDVYAKQEAQINPMATCNGNVFTPEVQTVV